MNYMMQMFGENLDKNMLHLEIVFVYLQGTMNAIFEGMNLR
jgi:hypothetical protein